MWEGLPTDDLDTAHRVLQSRCRRVALRHLVEQDGPVTVPTLVDRAWGASDEETVRERVALEFHHRHLPVLADAGLVHVADGEVALTDRGRAVAAVARGVADATEDAGTRA